MHVTFANINDGSLHGIITDAVDPANDEAIARQRMRHICNVQGWDFDDFAACAVESTSPAELTGLPVCI